MLTGYWPIDVFLYANMALCVFVAGIFGYYQYTGGGGLIDSNADSQSKE